MSLPRFSPFAQALSLVVLVAGCSNGPSPVSPTPPTRSTHPPVAGTVSGIVYEVTANGRVPVPDVEVYCDDCGHEFSFTEANGEYTFSPPPGGDTLLLVAKPGYSLPRPDWTDPNPTPQGWLGGVNVFVDGNTRFDIEIVPR